MSLYAALAEILVDEGPLDALHVLRLPAGQVGPVDVAYVPQGGAGSERYLGSAPVVDGPPGVTHDGGVLWHRNDRSVPGAWRRPCGPVAGCGSRGFHP